MSQEPAPTPPESRRKTLRQIALGKRGASVAFAIAFMLWNGAALPDRAALAFSLGAGDEKAGQPPRRLLDVPQQQDATDAVMRLRYHYDQLKNVITVCRVVKFASADICGPAADKDGIKNPKTWQMAGLNAALKLLDGWSFLNVVVTTPAAFIGAWKRYGTGYKTSRELRALHPH